MQLLLINVIVSPEINDLTVGCLAIAVFTIVYYFTIIRKAEVVTQCSGRYGFSGVMARGTS